MSMICQIVIQQPAKLEIGAGPAKKVRDWAAGASQVLVLAVSGSRCLKNFKNLERALANPK